jgi:hypothetical protein
VAEKTRIAFELYLEGRFKESSEIHRSLQVLFPEGAGLSQVFLERCATLEAMPPSSWDGIFEAKEK